MKTSLSEIEASLKHALSAQAPDLRVNIERPGLFEVSGTKTVMQGKQKVDGHYFAGVVPKPKDIRLYFFPIYTHVSEFPPLSEELNKSLKGKSCFHIKKMSPAMEEEIGNMIEQGVKLYKRDNLI